MVLDCAFPLKTDARCAFGYRNPAIAQTSGCAPAAPRPDEPADTSANTRAAVTASLDVQDPDVTAKFDEPP